MQGKFKWTVLTVICLSLIYLAFTNRYVILEAEGCVQFSLNPGLDASGGYVQIGIIKYNRWTHKAQIQVTGTSGLPYAEKKD